MNAFMFSDNGECGTPGSTLVPSVGFGVPPKRTSETAFLAGVAHDQVAHVGKVRLRGTRRPTRRRRVLPGVLFAALCASTIAAELDDPAAELASFKLPPGFQANLFASEKDGVIKPIQMRWDTRGRLWVIGSQTYPQLVPGEEPNDKVLILEDTNGDGVCDRTTVFADGLMIPTGLEIAPTPSLIAPVAQLEGIKNQTIDAPKLELRATDPVAKANASAIADTIAVVYSDNPRIPSACYVGEGTKLLLLTDTDGDGKCDKREVVLRGFGTGDNHQNINSFRWSPGGELFFSQGLHAHARIETAYGIVPLDEAGFWRYRPREGRLDSFYGGPAEPQNPWGFVWTDWGQMLMCAGNNGGIYWPLPEMIRGYRYGKRDQIWENARGRKSSGPDIIGTAHLPPEWQGVFLTGGYINNAVWAMDIHDDGAGFKLTDRDPLVTSTHGSFRCVDVKIGPDGAIYLCDWYNPIIGHYQASFRHPDRDKSHGRIWRITYKDRPLVKPPKIAGATLPELFENLKSGERWVREMTRLELMGRNEARSDTDLNGFDPQKLQAFWMKLDPADPKTDHVLFEILGVFESRGITEGRLLNRLLESKNANARAYAAGVVARWWTGKDPGIDAIYDEMAALVFGAVDDHPRVRLAAMIAAANVGKPVPAIVAASEINKELAATVFAAAEKAAESGDRQYALDVNAMHSRADRDKFTDVALRSAVAGLQRNSAGDPKIQAKFAELQRPPGSPKSAPSAKSADKISATVPATGKLRATPEFVAALVHEVRDSGDVKHGGEVFRRAELACTACHSIADQGGKIGPPLDAIGSGQPLDFIIGATLEPQREIKESYEALQLTAKDGRTALGYIAARDPQQTTVRDPATGAETKFANTDIAEQKQLGSFMPAGLVDNLSREDLRDLFAYLAQLGKPK